MRKGNLRKKESLFELPGPERVRDAGKGVTMGHWSRG